MSARAYKFGRQGVADEEDDNGWGYYGSRSGTVTSTWLMYSLNAVLFGTAIAIAI